MRSVSMSEPGRTMSEPLSELSLGPSDRMSRPLAVFRLRSIGKLSGSEMLPMVSSSSSRGRAAASSVPIDRARLGPEFASASREQEVREMPLPLVLKTDAFEDGGIVPARYGCFGDNVQPALAFKNVPENAGSICSSCSRSTASSTYP